MINELKTYLLQELNSAYLSLPTKSTSSQFEERLKQKRFYEASGRIKAIQAVLERLNTIELETNGHKTL